MKKTFLLMIALLACTIAVSAQESPAVSTTADNVTVDVDRASIGLGGGMDFGGFGLSLLLYPQKNIGIFAGAGYALAGVGINAGVRLRLFSCQHPPRLQTSLLGMYGYNAAIHVQNMKQLDKFFYGPSMGLYFDIGHKPGRKGYLSFAVLVPFRKSEVKDYMDELKYEHNVEFQNELWPVSFSIGYRFLIHS